MTPNEFKQWRLGLGVTQSQAAKVLGFKNRSSICLYEQGKRQITRVLELATERLTKNRAEDYLTILRHKALKQKDVI